MSENRTMVISYDMFNMLFGDYTQRWYRDSDGKPQLVAPVVDDSDTDDI